MIELKLAEEILRSAVGLSFTQGVAAVEAVLREALPFITFSNAQRKVGQRVALAWNGWFVYPMKTMDPPPPTAEELRQALAGLVEDAREVLGNVFPLQAAVEKISPSAP